MEKVLLYKYKDNEKTAFIYGYLKEGQLEIMVAFIEKIWNDEIHENYYLLTKEDTKKLYSLLKGNLHSDVPLMDLVKDTFQGPECEKKFIEFIDENEMSYTYYTC